MAIISKTSEKGGLFFKLSIIFTVLFFDFLFFAAIIPLVPLLILEPQNSLLAYETSLKSRCVLLGALYSVYPLSQMLFSPLLGAFSDKFGRKTMLLTAYLGNSIGYFLFACGVYTSQVTLLFLGFFIAGATGCNISTTNTIISDLCKEEEKLKRYSLSNMVIGLAFILGPFFAGKATQIIPHIPRLAFLTFLSCGVISLVNTGIIFRYFQNPPLNETQKKHSPLALGAVFKQDKELFFVLGGTFLLFFGWYSFIKFFQALFLNSPHFRETEIFNALSYFGICCVISQLLFSLFLHKIFKGRKSLCFVIILLAFSILASAFVTQYVTLMATVTLFAFAYSILCPCLIFQISEFGTSATRGRIMGFYQSAQDLAKVLAPLIAGCTMAVWTKGPALIACGFILCSLAAFYLKSKMIMRTEQDSNL